MKEKVKKYVVFSAIWNTVFAVCFFGSEEFRKAYWHKAITIITGLVDIFETVGRVSAKIVELDS